MAKDDRPLILAVCIIFPLVAIASVIARFESRRLKRVRLGADDWTALAALILSVGVSIDLLICSRVGNLGGHTKFDDTGEPILDNSSTVFGQTTYVLDLLVWPAVGVTKISVLLLYARIFVSKGFKILIWITIGFVVAWIVAFDFALMFSCTPIKSQWNPLIDSSCVDEVKLFTAALATDVITDGLILLYPVYNIWKLQMPSHRKLAIIFIFLLGGLVTVTGVIRLHFLTFVFASLEENPQFNDTTFIYGPVFYWSVIETNVGVLSACLPTFRPLYEGYRLDFLVSKISSPFSSESRSTVRSNSIRLKSMETGRKGSQTLISGRKDSRGNVKDPYPFYENDS